MKLSVIIPCYNESRTIEQIIRAVRSAPVSPLETAVVDDGSADGTREILATLGLIVDQIICQPSNYGKGAAVRAGFAVATGRKHSGSFRP